MSINGFLNEIDGVFSSICPNRELYQFSPFDLDQLKISVMFEMIKTAYDRLEPKYSLRQHRGTDEDDARMQDSRNMSYVQHYRNLQFLDMLERYGYGEEGLLPHDVKSMEGKLEGYKLSKLQYYEMIALEIHPIFKTLVSKRVCDVKKISNKTFIGYMHDYEMMRDSLIRKLDGDDDDVLFGTIELFTLEWKYCIELFYRCAIEAEMNNCVDVEKNKMIALCGDVEIPWFLTDDIKSLGTESRFIPFRNELVPYMYNDDEWEEINEKMFEYLTLKEFILHFSNTEETIIDRFCKETTRKEWANYIRSNFDITQLYSEKEWTNKRIRYVRKCYEVMYVDHPTPKSK